MVDKETEIRYQTLLHNLPGMAYQCYNDSGWKMIFVSNACEVLTGYKPHQLVNNQEISYEEIIHEEDREYVRSTIGKALKEGIQFELEYRIITADRSEKWVWERGVQSHSSQGYEILLEGVIMDISRRKKVEMKIQEDELRYISIFDNAPISLIEVDFSKTTSFIGQLGEKNSADFIKHIEDNPEDIIRCVELLEIIQINKQTISLFEAESLESSTASTEIIKVFYTEQFIELFSKSLAKLSKRITEFEFGGIIQTIKGNKRNIVSKWILIQGDKVDKERLFISFIDTTARTSAEENMIRQYQLNKKILETTMDGYILADMDGKIIDVNPSYCKMTGYTYSQLLEMNIRDLEISIPAEEIEARIQRMLAKGSDRFETKHRHKNGAIIDLDTSISIMQINDQPFVAAFVRDITMYKRAEKELKAHRKDLEKLVSQRTSELESINNQLLDKNRELEKFNRIFINREFRIKELKEELRALKNVR